MKRKKGAQYPTNTPNFLVLLVWFSITYLFLNIHNSDRRKKYSTIAITIEFFSLTVFVSQVNHTFYL